MRTKDGDRIGAIIAQHIGSENAVSAPRIARALGWKQGCEREVRRIIAAQSMLWKFEMVEKPGCGFFAAETFEEIETNLHWLDALADTAAEKAKLKRIHFSSRGIHIPKREKAKKEAA